MLAEEIGKVLRASPSTVCPLMGSSYSRPSSSSSISGLFIWVVRFYLSLLLVVEEITNRETTVTKDPIMI